MSLEPINFPLTGHLTPEEIEASWDTLTPEQQMEYLDLDDSWATDEVDQDIARAKDGDGPRVTDPAEAEEIARTIKPLIDKAIEAEKERASLIGKTDSGSVALRALAANIAYEHYMFANMEASNPGSTI